MDYKRVVENVQEREGKGSHLDDFLEVVRDLKSSTEEDSFGFQKQIRCAGRDRRGGHCAVNIHKETTTKKKMELRQVLSSFCAETGGCLCRDCQQAGRNVEAQLERFGTRG